MRRVSRAERMASSCARVSGTGPDRSFITQDRYWLRGKLADQEKFKRDQHPFDAYQRLKEQAANDAPKPDDNFRWRFFGLFYVAPAQK